MANMLHITLLYDFYCELLTKKQRQIFEMHYFNDLSFNEIAGELYVSSQAVNDILKRTEKHLLNYEEKLNLLDKHNKRKEEVNKIISLLECLSDI